MSTSDIEDADLEAIKECISGVAVEPDGSKSPRVASPGKTVTLDDTEAPKSETVEEGFFSDSDAKPPTPDSESASSGPVVEATECSDERVGDSGDDAEVPESSASGSLDSIPIEDTSPIFETSPVDENSLIGDDSPGADSAPVIETCPAVAIISPEEVDTPVESHDTTPVAAPPPPAAVRGRGFTQPAWKTANLVAESKAKEEAELHDLERRVEEMRRRVSELDSLIDSKAKERDELHRQMTQRSGPPRPVSQPPALTVPAPPVPERTFVVEVDRRDGTPIGLSVGFDEAGGCFVVSDVKSSGCIAAWNSRSKLQVRNGDRIAQVNGISRNRDLMTREFKSPLVQLVIDPVGQSRPPVGRPPAPQMPMPRTPEPAADKASWPRASLEAYQEIMGALNDRSNRAPRTGIMKYGDVPVRRPDLPSGSFTCQICETTTSGVQQYVDHMRSIKHENMKNLIQSSDVWTRCVTEDGRVYWYEHKIGFWSIDDPDSNGIGYHTVVR